MAPKRRNTGKAPTEAPSAPVPTNRFGIIFRDAAHEARYNILSQRRLINTRYMHKDTLERLGLFDDVQWMCAQAGWGTFCNQNQNTYPGITLEFLSSLDVKISLYDLNDPGKIRFRLENREHRLTLAEFSDIFGFPTGVPRDPPIEYHEAYFWTEIARGEHFSPKTARASALSNPCFKYIHRFMAHTIFGRGDSDGMVRQTELLFIWCMLNNCLLDAGFYLIKHLDKAAKAPKGLIVIGGLITPIAHACGVTTYGMEKAQGNDRLDFETCIAMKMIARTGEGYSLLFKGSDFTLPLPNTARTSPKDRGNWRITDTPDIDETAPLAMVVPSGGYQYHPYPSPPPSQHYTTGHSRSQTSMTTDEMLRAIMDEQRAIRQEQERQGASIYNIERMTQELQRSHLGMRSFFRRQYPDYRSEEEDNQGGHDMED